MRGLTHISFRMALQDLPIYARLLEHATLRETTLVDYVQIYRTLCAVLQSGSVQEIFDMIPLIMKLQVGLLGPRIAQFAAAPCAIDVDVFRLSHMGRVETCRDRVARCAIPVDGATLLGAAHDDRRIFRVRQ
jgi:hypothetical protein